MNMEKGIRYTYVKEDKRIYKDSLSATIYTVMRYLSETPNDHVFQPTLFWHRFIWDDDGNYSTNYVQLTLE